jgi:hypothetical protein
LSSFAFGGVLAGFGAEVLFAVEFFDAGSSGGDGLVRQVYGVCPHIGDVALFVKALGDPHGVAGRQTEFAVRFLLEGRGGEGGRGFAGCGAFFEVADAPGFVAEALFEGFGLFLVEEEDVSTGSYLAGVFVKVGAGGDFSAG